MINRFLVAAPLAAVLSLGLLGVAATPASAASIDCATAPVALKAAAAGAQADVARKALAQVRTGEALCAADNRFEAGHKFSLAAKTLGVDVATLSGATTASAN